MKGFLRKAFLVLSILTLIFSVFAAHIFFRFDLLFNPFVQAVRSPGPWGERAQLISKPFKAQQARESVEAKLARYGFEKLPDDKVWARYKYEIDEGREVFTREADRFPCNIKVYVFVEFDERDRLIFAEGTQHEHGCL